MHNEYVYGIDNDINQVSISLWVRLISLNTLVLLTRNEDVKKIKTVVSLLVRVNCERLWWKLHMGFRSWPNSFTVSLIK